MSSHGSKSSNSHTTNLVNKISDQLSVSTDIGPNLSVIGISVESCTSVHLKCCGILLVEIVVVMKPCTCDISSHVPTGTLVCSTHLCVHAYIRMCMSLRTCAYKHT